MGNIWGLILSLVLVFGIILLSQLLVKLFHLTKEESRKLVHIGVSNWWLVAMLAFDSWQWAIIPAVIFIVLNLISWYTGAFSAMERQPRNPHNLGTVYFPISLSILVILTWHDSPVFAEAAPYIGGLGILAMGYGDGLAALVGTRSGRRKYNILGTTKSLEGSLAMFIGSLVPIFILLMLGAQLGFLPALAYAVALATLATLVEAITPWGLDNLTVPLIISLAWIVVVGI